MRTEAGAESGIRVVVVDDEPHVVEYLETVLGLSGMAVVGTAFDADGAVEVVHRVRPDVALLDLRMPGGGLYATRLIGLLTPETRILIFSAQADCDDLLPLLQAGIDGYVVKGCSPDRLTEAIEAVVAGQHYLTPQASRFAANQLAARLDAEEHAEMVALHVRSRVVEAMEPGGFVTELQPVRDVVSSAVHSVEALTRFTEEPYRSPPLWLADADASGLRVSLELSLANAAIGQIERMRSGVSLGLNLSPATILSGRLHDVLAGANRTRVILELTEHAPVDDYQALNASLDHWRKAGVRLAVDDAGAGYSSFAHILELAPDFIKLDVSLTHDIHLDRRRQALARALIGYATEMQVQVIAEGIESVDQLAMVRELGVHLAQGHLLGRPRPLDEQPELLGTGAGGSVPAVLDLRDPAASWDRADP